MFFEPDERAHWSVICAGVLRSAARSNGADPLKAPKRVSDCDDVEIVPRPRDWRHRVHDQQPWSSAGPAQVDGEGGGVFGRSSYLFGGAVWVPRRHSARSHAGDRTTGVGVGPRIRILASRRSRDLAFGQVAQASFGETCGRPEVDSHELRRNDLDAAVTRCGGCLRAVRPFAPEQRETTRSVVEGARRSMSEPFVNLKRSPSRLTPARPPPRRAPL
jgi:hypothetical protein